MNTKRVKLLVLFVLTSLVIVVLVAPQFSSGAAQKSPFKKLLASNETLAPKTATMYPLSTSGKLCSLSVSIPTPSEIGDTGTINVVLRDGAKIIARKPLHVGDPDLYLTFRATGRAQLELTSQHDKAIAPVIQVLEWPDNKMPNVEAEPNDTWQDANEFQLGKTMFATADDIPYIAPLNADTTNYKRGYEQTPEYADRLPEGGADWFKFNFTEDTPKLVHFEIDLLERDNIPVDVSVFTIENNQAKPYEKGADPVTPPHEVQALPGNKFTTRVLTKGTYYVKVEARHPAYQLRTYVYDLPPYSNPVQAEAARKAVRAGMDFIVSAGDSWHANTPRHGGIVNRVSNNHNETMGCVACHATHFPLRAELTAKQNGYAIQKRAAVQFLTERFYNTTRPFYGHPEASWTRVISASANVLSRMAALLNLYETEVTGERHTEYLKGVVNYLKLYYKGRTYLPNDETNGNTPLVSAYEVAMYSWKAFDEYAKQAGDKESLEYREQVRKLIEQDRHKNLIDLCYQTQAMTMMDANAYADKIKRNAERLLSLQRADGQWSMLFEPDSASVEFQTGHSLYTLALAGYKPDHPQIKKAVAYLLARQQEWGGWFDPRQSYENFRTPFRETQFAVMALSQLYPEANKQKGWNAATPEKLSDDPYVALEQMSNVWVSANWGMPKNEFIRGMLRSAISEDALIRQAASAAFGHYADQVSPQDAPQSPDYDDPLGDENKMVQLAHSWSERQYIAKHRIDTTIVRFLDFSSNRDKVNSPKPEREVWGAARIFSQHFSVATRFSHSPVIFDFYTHHSPMIRMQAIKSLSQWFYWTKDETLRWKIVDEIIARIGTETHPWVRRNLIEALYSMSDENVRYLYNNWIALLATPEDRERAKQGHRNHSLQMAKRIAAALENGNALQREGLLQAITEFHLRAGGYAGGGRYTRIGNDVENVQFYDDGAKLMEKALVPLIKSDNLKLRKQAIVAANTVRDQALDSLPLLVLEQLNDSNAEVRSAAQETYRLLPLTVREQNKQAAIGILKALLASPYPAAQTAGLERLKVFSNAEARAEKLDMAVRDFVVKAERGVAPAALMALAEFPHLASDTELQARVTAALQASDEGLQRAAATLAMNKAEWRAAPSIQVALNSLLQNKDAAKRRLVLGLVTDATTAQTELALPKLVAEACYDANDQVRAAALSAARRSPSLLKNPTVKAGLEKLMVDKNASLQEQAVAFVQGQGDAYLDGAAAIAKATANVGKASTTNLDYAYFVQRVMPILSAKGRDGNACMDCHYNHTVLKLNLPGANGQWSDAQIRDNFTSALRVVDSTNPENSLLLRKPLGNADVEGTIGAKKIPHGGGQRWTGVDDAAYKTILEWINGARLATK
ncbi:MAG: hypothetical protein JST84_15145 [Acidobacteria bacterium]|nr:hypothetical protein [Acidobacteriota bacterium]